MRTQHMFSHPDALYGPKTFVFKAHTIASCLSSFSVKRGSVFCTDCIVESFLSILSLICLSFCAMLPMSIFFFGGAR